MNKKMKIVFMAIFVCLVYLGVTNVTAQNDETSNESLPQTVITNINNDENIKEDKISDNEKVEEAKDDSTEKNNDEVKKKDKSLASLAAASIYFKDIGINNIKTGTATMDSNNNPGNDSSDSNDIVRSFDTVVYPLSINLASNDGNAYKNIKIKVTGEVTNGVSSDGRILNALFDQGFNGTYDMTKKTSTMNYTIGNVKTGAAVGYNIPLNVQGATNGLVLNSSFKVQLMSAEDEDGNTINLEDENIIEEINTNDIKVSSKVNLKLRIAAPYSSNTFDFDDFTKTTDNIPSDISVRGISIGIQPLSGRTNLLGSAFPTNDVEVTLSTILNQKDEFTGVSSPINIGTDSRGLSIFDYGYNSEGVMAGHLHDAKYDNHTDISVLDQYITVPSIPCSQYKNSCKTKLANAYDSGNITANNTIDNKMTIKFNNFVISDIFPTRMLGNISTDTYNLNNERIFATARFTMVEPNEKAENNKSIEYTLLGESASYTENTLINNQDLNVKNQWSKTAYPEGTLRVKSIYLDSAGKSTGSSVSSALSTGDHKASEKQKLLVQTLATTAVKNYDNINLIQKWNPKESIYDSSRKVTISPPVGVDNLTAKTTIKYGVSKDNDFSLVGLNKKVENDYIWYNTPEEAETNGTISSVTVKFEKLGLKLLNSNVFFRVPRTVVGTIGTAASDTTPYITLSGATVTWNEAKNAITYDGLKEKSNYIPTTYKANGEVDKLHTPNNWYGGTLNIQPIIVKIAKQSDNINYAGDAKAKWTITPTIEAYNPITNGEITIKDTLPKGVEYEAGTAKYGNALMEPEVTNNADGTTELKWNIKNLNDSKLEKITFDTSFNQLTLSFNSSGIAPLVNKVVISSPSDISPESMRTATYDFNVIKKSQWGIYKSVDTPLIDMSSTDAFTYDLEMYNNSGEDRTSITGFDVLPKNGYLNSSINGTYKITDISATSGDTKLYYTTQDINPDSDPNTLESDVVAGNNGWIEYTGGGLDVVAKAIFFTKPLLEDNKSEIVKVSVLPNGNKAGDFYINRAYGNSDANSKVISNTQKTSVVNRILEGITWYDENYNGLIDSKEARLANIPVTLYTVDSFGNLTKLTKNLLGEDLVDSNGNSLIKSDSNGNYKFNALPALSGNNKYVVGFGIKDKVDSKVYNITKSEVADGAIELTNKAYSDQTEENDILTNKSTPYEMPLINDMKSTTHTQSYVNLGVIPPAKLSLKKDVVNTKKDTTSIDKGTIEPKENAKYTLIAKNESQYSYAEDVVITDTIPTGLTYVPGTLELVDVNGKKSKLADSNISGQNISVEIGRMAGLEQVTLSFEVVVADGKKGAMTNIADITGEDPIEGDVPEKSNEVVITSVLPELQATKVVEDCTEDGTVENGEELTYTIYLRNVGDGIARNVKIVDLLNDDEFSGSTIEKATIIKDGVELTKEANIVTGYNIGDLKANGLVKIQFKVIMKNPINLNDKIVSNQASITSDNHEKVLTTNDIDPNDPSVPRDPDAPATPTEIDVKNAKLVGTKMAEDKNKDGYIENGEIITYTLHFKNIGEIAARSVIIKDELLDDEFKNATVYTATATKDSIIYTGNIKSGIDVEDIEVNQVVKVVFKVKMPAKMPNTGLTPGLVVNQAQAKAENTPIVYTCGDIDPNDPTTSKYPDNPPVPTTMPKENPLLTGTKVVKDGNGDNKFSPNETLYYTLYFRNIGKVSATNVVIKDPLSDAEFKNAVVSKAIATKGSNTYTGNIKKGINVGDVASNELVTVKFSVKMPSTINKDTKSPNQLINQANAKGSNTDIVYTTSDVDPNDPTKPRDLTAKPKSTNLERTVQVPITGDNSIVFIGILMILGISVIGIARRYKLH